MRYFAAAALAGLLISACGGGGGDEVASGTEPTPSPTTVQPPVQATENTPTPEVPTLALSQDAPLNNLDLGVGANYSTTTSSVVCGYQMPSKVLTGTVSSVHDGDTIKIGTINIRLDSIDAPELSQTYGRQSQENLAFLVLNKQVSVYYSKIDKYGRTIGSVFTNDCSYINLQQVTNGAAWHYTAYQCEQPVTTRTEFSIAQKNAEDKNIGLWEFLATPPWVYRNGAEPAVPNCTSDNPIWMDFNTSTPINTGSTLGTGPVPSSGSSLTSSPPSSGTNSYTSTYTPVTGCKTVWVNSYTRKDGTRVKGHYRRIC